MAREYARVKLTIWTDPDFHSLTGDAQRLYFVLLTNGSLNLCGVTDWLHLIETKAGVTL